MQLARSPEVRATMLIDTIKTFFNNRIRSKYGTDKITCDAKIADHTIHFTFITANNEQHTLSVPIPFEEQGVYFIQTNETRRAIGSFFIMEEQKELDYLSVISSLFCDVTESPITKALSTDGPFIQKIIRSFNFNNTSVIVRRLQKIIDDITTRMPVHKTQMNSWAMNQRVWIIDPRFDTITNPKEKLEYQVEKSKKLFPKGWTTIGLADSVLADRNYILKTSLRKTIPFGLHFHNPQRNLYSTLGMKGDEQPLIKSETMEVLRQKGICRGGWNLFTAFIDIPDVWEDQIIVDRSLCDKFIDYQRVYRCYGTLKVSEQQELEKDTTLSINKDNEPTKIRLNADRIWVEQIEEKEENVGGILTVVNHVVVKYRRFIKDGTKITNLAANKGVVRVKDLGYATNPMTGERRKIDVLVSCRAVEKRKNYTQILEALVNHINGEQPKVYVDDISFSKEHLEQRLLENNIPKDGSWECHTYAGKMNGVCGTVFWGVTMDAEDMIWDQNDTLVTNNRNLRTAGLKMSMVELRAIMTRFGWGNNPIINEILHYAQGYDDIKDLLSILYSKEGNIIPGKQTIDVESLRPLDQTGGILMEKETIKDTIADENFQPEGFVLKLPVEYQIDFDENNEVYREGIPLDTEGIPEITRSIKINHLYVPGSNLRRCWKHSVGKYGLSEIGSYLNTIVTLVHRYKQHPEDRQLYCLISQAIHNYFARVSSMLGSKRGEISTHGMAIRYPHSFKGVATLSNELPKNTVEIHEDMAKQCDVHQGDIVLIERFPCLGFMSVRPQQVYITKDPLCKYTIRVSGNSLTSLSLDFDGDVLFGAVFHTKEARDLLYKEWRNPNKTCYEAIKTLNEKSGKPHYKSLTLEDYNIEPFAPLTAESHAEIVAKATGVKANTGPVIALAYNIMRIVENSEYSDNQKVNAAVEIFLDKVANSVFKQKHGVKSLHEIVVDAICTADVETLVQEGFRRGTSTTICNLIKDKAAQVGINDLTTFHKQSQSTVLNQIVRKQNKIYFCSRAQLEGVSLIKHIEEPAVDIPSKMFKYIIQKQ